MKTKIILILTSLWIGTLAKAECDNAKTARQAVKALVAIEDIKGVTSYYGGLAYQDALITSINVQPTYEKTRDWYVITIRNKDCRILSTVLRAEGLPVSAN